MESVGWLSSGFFVLVTGTHLLPQIINYNYGFFTMLYAISIVIATAFFVVNGLPFNISQIKNGHRERS